MRELRTEEAAEFRGWPTMLERTAKLNLTVASVGPLESAAAKIDWLIKAFIPFQMMASDQDLLAFSGFSAG